MDTMIVADASTIVHWGAVAWLGGRWLDSRSDPASTKGREEGGRGRERLRRHCEKPIVAYREGSLIDRFRTLLGSSIWGGQRPERPRREPPGNW
jgi:hypothetical protein